MFANTWGAYDKIQLHMTNSVTVLTIWTLKFSQLVNMVIEYVICDQKLLYASFTYDNFLSHITYFVTVLDLH